MQTLNDSPTLNRPDGEPTVFRNPSPDKIYSNTYELGLKTLEDPFEAMRCEIPNIKKAKSTNKHNVTRHEELHSRNSACVCVFMCVCVNNTKCGRALNISLTTHIRNWTVTEPTKSQ